MLAKIVNDDVGTLGIRGALAFFASGLMGDGLFESGDLPALEGDEKTDAEVFTALACFGLDEGIREKYLNQSVTRFISRYEALLKAAAIPCPRSGRVLLKLLKNKYQK